MVYPANVETSMPIILVLQNSPLPFYISTGHTEFFFMMNWSTAHKPLVLVSIMSVFTSTGLMSLLIDLSYLQNGTNSLSVNPYVLT